MPKPARRQLAASRHAGHALGAAVRDVKQHHGLLRLLRVKGHVHNEVALALQLRRRGTGVGTEGGRVEGGHRGWAGREWADLGVNMAWVHGFTNKGLASAFYNRAALSLIERSQGAHLDDLALLQAAHVGVAHRRRNRLLQSQRPGTQLRTHGG